MGPKKQSKEQKKRTAADAGDDNVTSDEIVAAPSSKKKKSTAVEEGADTNESKSKGKAKVQVEKTVIPKSELKTIEPPAGKRLFKVLFLCVGVSSFQKSGAESRDNLARYLALQEHSSSMLAVRR